MIYKNLLITQANEVAQLLNDYIIFHNKRLQLTGTFSSLFKNKDYLKMYEEIDRVKTDFENKECELKEIKEEYYESFADISVEFFDVLEGYFNALFDVCRNFNEIFLIFLRNDDAFYASKFCSKELFLEASDWKHAASNRNFTSHRDILVNFDACDC